MGRVVLGEETSVSTPSAGVSVMYPRAGRWYYKDEDGIEHPVSHQPIRKNVLINGDFNIWQRGSSFAAAADGTYGPDRFMIRDSGAGIATMSRSTDVPTVAQAGRLFNYSMDIQVTTVDSSLVSTDWYAIEHRVEGHHWLALAQRPCILSFWAKAKKTGIYCASLRDSVGSRSFVREFTINAADTWEFKTCAFDASPSAGTWDFTTGIGVYLDIVMASGSDKQGTGGSWQTGNYVATTNQVNAYDNTANYLRIAGVQLEAGTVATDFEQRLYQDEFLLCRRYYRSLGGTSNDPMMGGGYIVNGTLARFVYPLEPPMRATPTLTIATGAVNVRSFAGVTDNTGTPTVNGDYRVLIIDIPINGTHTGGQGADMYSRLNGSALISAEL